MDKLKVLLHVNESERFSVAADNAANLLIDAGDGNVDAIMLMNGKSVIVLDDPACVDKMEELAGKGIRFHVCRNSLKKMHSKGKLSLTEETLPAFANVVSAGITEIIRQQNDAYAYVKP